MRKNLTIFCVFVLMLFSVSTAFAAFNSNAYFKLDSNLATTGFQDNSKLYVLNVGSGANVGFAIYSQAWNSSAGFTVAFEWDGTKATFQLPPSGTKIDAATMTINGASATIPAETNILGTGALLTIGETNSAGYYTNSFASLGTPSTTAVGLVYFAVFKTADTFKTTDQVTFKVSVTVSDADGASLFLGYRYFSVNQVSVKTSTWGDVKTQFKDF